MAADSEKDIGTLSHWSQAKCWYSWVDSNHRPPDPQSGALTN